MGLGAFGVSMQLCLSDYVVNYKKIGLLGLSPSSSNIVHSVSALLLFGTMIYWVGCRFTKGVGDDDRTNMKKWRNRVYKTCALLSLSGVLFFIVGPILGVKASVWTAEELILLPLSTAIFVKAGGWLKDSEK